ncbi:hypothetical protein DPMN_066636 [Dreissena polymorpha]|uniref:Uncharacterized protein n=1 Tax=Dreissena polymorpha TaxID=45954 RepID=A0A9D4BT16_DREPO|nr:hypothetical protein DPMN_066636 [Dreissena polymorpha]
MDQVLGLADCRLGCYSVVPLRNLPRNQPIALPLFVILNHPIVSVVTVLERR